MRFSRGATGFCVLLTLNIATCHIVYDATTCGYPSTDLAKLRMRRQVSNASDEYNVTDYNDNESDEAQEDNDNAGYEDDYSLDANSTEPTDANDPLRKKVMGGKKVERGELPWNVLLLVNIDDNISRIPQRFLKKFRINPNVDKNYATTQYMDGVLVLVLWDHNRSVLVIPKVCGGTLITRRHVITAAHCFWGPPENEDEDKCSIKEAYPVRDVIRKARVVVGGVCMEESEEEDCQKEDIGVQMKIKRAWYAGFYEEGCDGTRDIAFLELARDVPEGIHHVCLPHLHDVDDMDDATTKLFSCGFGSNPLAGYEYKVSPRLQKIDLGLRLSESECKLSEPTKMPDTFCTQEYSEKDVCHGDSGGGITSVINGRHYLVGLVSYGTSCEDLVKGAAPKAQVHTDIEYYTAAIDTFIDMRVEDRKSRWEKVLL